MLQQARSLGAASRQQRRDDRSSAEQIALLDTRPGVAERERGRLAETSQ